MKVVLDTNIIIDHLRGVPEAREQLRNIENGLFEGYISTITVMVLLSAPRISEQRYEAIKNLLEAFENIPVDKKIATIAGMLLSKYRATHGIDPLDALIAATALANEAVLFTLNKKHFRFVDGLVSMNPYLTDI